MTRAVKAAKTQTDLSTEAEVIVTEMAALGAVFTITDLGPTGEPRWHWQPVPEVMRNAIRKVWASTEHRTAPGFNVAMVEAIQRHHGGARAQ